MCIVFTTKNAHKSTAAAEAMKRARQERTQEGSASPLLLASQRLEESDGLSVNFVIPNNANAVSQIFSSPRLRTEAIL